MQHKSWRGVHLNPRNLPPPLAYGPELLYNSWAHLQRAPWTQGSVSNNLSEQCPQVSTVSATQTDRSIKANSETRTPLYSGHLGLSKPPKGARKEEFTEYRGSYSYGASYSAMTRTAPSHLHWEHTRVFSTVIAWILNLRTVGIGTTRRAVADIGARRLGEQVHWAVNLRRLRALRRGELTHLRL